MILIRAWEEEKESQGENRRGMINGVEQPLRVPAMKMKNKIKGRRKVREPRFCFKTLSDVDVLDDGYKWRKYGQKVVKNTLHPRYIYIYNPTRNPNQFKFTLVPS